VANAKEGGGNSGRGMMPDHTLMLRAHRMRKYARSFPRLYLDIRMAFKRPPDRPIPDGSTRNIMIT
jgi:hypothetical protein